jgi:predicted phosphohydrolase
MKIALASDVHLEFGDLFLKNEESADVLLLSGDIMVADKYKGNRIFHDFLSRASFQFPHVIYIAGNHEFYDGHFDYSIHHLRNVCANFPNVYFLEDDIKQIDDVIFIGCTLWTDMNRSDPNTMLDVMNRMNDFRKIRATESWHRLHPEQVVSRHRKSLEYIKTAINGHYDKKFVVVGHHAPSKLSTHPRYKNDVEINGAYSSDLSGFILDHPQIKLWTHGHTHDPYDYQIGSTRIVCNPRGYIGHEDSADTFQLKHLEV